MKLPLMQGICLLLLFSGGWSLAGCTGSSASTVHKVAFFDIVEDRGPLKRTIVADLSLQVRQMIEHWEGIVAIDPQQIQREIRRGPKQFRKQCNQPECQIMVGRKLRARQVLALWIKPNILADCEVFGAFYDLQQKDRDYRSRARGECEPAAIRSSLNKVVCFLIAQGNEPREGTRGPGPRHAECLSMAALIQVEHQFKLFRQQKVVLDPRRRAEQEIKLAEQVMELKRNYLAVGDGKQDRWSVSARCRVGQVYEEYASAVERLYQKGQAPPAVRRMGKEAVARYEGEVNQTVRQKMAPLYEMALKSYGECLRLAKESSLSSRYIIEARTRLNRLKQTRQ